MNDVVRAITWEAPEHHHIEKTGDWFWAVGIISISSAVAAFFFGNFLFAILILLAGATLSLAALRQPHIIPFSVSGRGVQIDETLHTYASLEAYHIDLLHYAEPQLLLRSKKIYMPLILLPIPEEYIDEIEEIVGSRLPEEELEEPFGNVLLEFFGF